MPGSRACGASTRPWLRHTVVRRVNSDGNAASRTARLRRWRSSAERPLVLRLAYRGELAWDAMLEFFAARTIPRHRGRPRRDTTAARASRRHERHRGGEPRRCRLMRTSSVARDFVFRNRNIARVDSACFRLGCRPHGDCTRTRSRPVLGRSVRNRPGLRVPGAWDGLEIAVRAIAGQQISVRAATAICARLVERFGERVGADALPFLFPPARALSRAPLEDVGLTGVKAGAIRAVARALDTGDLLLDGTQPCERVMAKLESLPGIGPWTAGYISMRALGEPDAFPIGDLGLRRVLGGEQQACVRARVARAQRRVETLASVCNASRMARRTGRSGRPTRERGETTCNYGSRKS